MAFKTPSHPDDFGYTKEGYDEWMQKHNPGWPRQKTTDKIKKQTTDLIEKHRKHTEGWMEAQGYRKFLRPYLNDAIVVNVLERIKTRADAGMNKYGVPMTRTDVDTIQWLRHAQEEAMDLAIYLERVISDLSEKKI